MGVLRVDGWDKDTQVFYFSVTLGGRLICIPPFPREQRVSPDRPAAVQGAKRRSAPLTARTDLESCSTRGKGYRTLSVSTPFWGAAPSLTAGINTDDSDPLGAGIEACHSAPLSGSVGTPLFGGGRYRLPEFFWIVILESE